VRDWGRRELGTGASAFERKLGSLPVAVNYGAPPQKITELLEAVAQAHPRVLRDPAPRAFFTSFGEKAINYFPLR